MPSLNLYLNVVLNKKIEKYMLTNNFRSKADTIIYILYVFLKSESLKSESLESEEDEKGEKDD